MTPMHALRRAPSSHVPGRRLQRLVALSLLVATLASACSLGDGDVEPTRAAPRGAAQPGGAGFGAWVGASSPERMLEFERWAGRRVTTVHSFLGHSSWDALHRQAEWAFRAWNGTGRQTVFSVPMLVNDGGTLRQGAAGAYDAHFRRLAELLVRNGQQRAYLRLGWEFNGDWFPWSAKADPASYAAYFRRIVKTMRAVPGAEGLRFDWCSAYGGDVPEASYPGDAYVDVIGMDVYDQSFSPRQADPAVRWDYVMNRSTGGLRWQRDFAAARGKPISFPEWAVSKGPHVANATPDNAYFVNEMAKWIASNDVAYALYFNEDVGGGHSLTSGSFPRAAAAFRAAFGD